MSDDWNRNPDTDQDDDPHWRKERKGLTGEGEEAVGSYDGDVALLGDLIRAVSRDHVLTQRAEKLRVSVLDRFDLLRSHHAAALLELAAAREDTKRLDYLLSEQAVCINFYGSLTTRAEIDKAAAARQASPSSSPGAPTKELRRCKANRPLKQWFPDMVLEHVHDDDGSVCTHGLREGLWDDYTEKTNAE